MKEPIIDQTPRTGNQRRIVVTSHTGQGQWVARYTAPLPTKPEHDEFNARVALAKRNKKLAKEFAREFPNID